MASPSFGVAMATPGHPSETPLERLRLTGGKAKIWTIAFAVQSVQRVHDKRNPGRNERISFGGFNIQDMRYADDAVLVSDKKKSCRR